MPLTEMLALRTVRQKVDRAGKLMSGGDTKQALQVALEASAIARDKIRVDHPQFISAMNMAAACQLHCEDYAGAERLLREVVDLVHRTPISVTDDFAVALNNLSIACGRQRRRADAIGFMERAIEVKRRIHGPHSINAMGNLQDIAIALGDEGRHEEAARYFEELYQSLKLHAGEDSVELAGTLDNLALALESCGRSTEAEIHRKRAREILRIGEAHAPGDSPDDPGQAPDVDDGNEVAAVLALYRNGSLDEASELHRKILARLPSIPYVGLIAGSHHLLDPFLPHLQSVDQEGHAAELSEDWATAASRYLQVIAMLRVSFDPRHPHQAAAVSNLARVRERQGQVDAAKDLYREALAGLRSQGDDEEPRRTVVGNIVELFWRSAEAIAPQIDSAEGLVKAFPAGKPAEYAPSLRVRFPLPVENESPLSNALRWLDARAKVYDSLGSVEQTRFLYRHAVELAELVHGAGDPEAFPQMSELLEFELKNAEYAEADSHLMSAIETAERGGSGMLGQIPGLLMKRAELLLRMARPALGEALLLRALDLVGRHRDLFASHATLVIEENLAVLRLQTGRSEEALPVLRRVVEAAAEKSAKELGPTRLQQLANFCNALGDREQALTHYERAIELHRKQSGEWTQQFALAASNYATSLREMGRWSEAEDWYRQALRIRRVVIGVDHPSVLDSEIRLALVLAASGRPEEALECALSAIDSGVRLTGRLSVLSPNDARLGLVQLQQSRMSIALSILFSELPRTQSNVERAFDIALRYKQVVAHSVLSRRTEILRGNHPELVDKLDELDNLCRQIVTFSLKPQGSDREEAAQIMEGAINARNDLERELSKAIPKVALDWSMESAGLADIESSLPQGAALVEFLRLERFNFAGVQAQGDKEFLPPHYAAWVLRPDCESKLVWLDLGPAEAIDSLVQQVLADYSDLGADARHLGINRERDSRAGSAEREHALSSKLLAPLLDVLGSAVQVFVVADAALALCPLDALPIGDEGRFIDKHALCHLGTARDLTRLASPVDAPQRPAVIVAAPDYDLAVSDGAAAGSQDDSSAPSPTWLRDGGIRFRALPGALAEGLAIEKQLASATLLTGRDAVESVVRSVRRPSILHLATHGFILDDHAGSGEVEEEDAMLRSAVALAGANTWLDGGSLPSQAEDGLLTAADVATLDLIDTDLAVLSACETGRGAVVSGEGIFGLRRAFAIAGARTTVMSLWKIPDAETQVLMSEFYKFLLLGLPKPSALREAKLAVRAKHPSPLHWAAFICEGDWHSLSHWREQAAAALPT